MFFKPKTVRLLLLVMIFVAGLISVYDNVLSYIMMDSLAETEQNPFASWIIGECGVVGLIYYKALGTMLATLWMIRLVYSKYRIAIVPVFCCQCVLFCYLTFYASSGFFDRDMLVPLQLVVEFYRELK
jgi:hypothetical protein